MLQGPTSEKSSFPLEKNPSVYDTQKNNFCVQLVRPPVFHQGGLWAGWRVVWWRVGWARSEVGAVRVRANISRFFFPLAALFCFSNFRVFLGIAVVFASFHH